ALAGEPIAAVVAVDTPARAGAERLRALRSLRPGTPLIACALPDRERARAQLGATAFLVKPVSPDQLAGALDRIGRPIRRVLVVDDDPDVVRLLAQMVRASAPRRRVLRAYGGAEALALARARRPDAPEPQRPSASSSSRWLNGLGRKSAAPSIRASSRSGKTEQTTTGIAAVRGWLRSVCRISQPSCSGIITSSAITSGSASAASARA